VFTVFLKKILIARIRDEGGNSFITELAKFLIFRLNDRRFMILVDQKSRSAVKLVACEHCSAEVLSVASPPPLPSA
jgi:hypothetical protein